MENVVSGSLGTAALEAVAPEAVDERATGWLGTLIQWALRPRERAPEVSEILEAHRMAWRRIEMRRQEFAPPDLGVAQRIMSGYGRTSKSYHGYERSAKRAPQRVERGTAWGRL